MDWIHEKFVCFRVYCTDLPLTAFGNKERYEFSELERKHLNPFCLFCSRAAGKLMGFGWKTTYSFSPPLIIRTKKKDEIK